jgi:hypothetical protein
MDCKRVHGTSGKIETGVFVTLGLYITVVFGLLSFEIVRYL